MGEQLYSQRSEALPSHALVCTRPEQEFRYAEEVFVALPGIEERADELNLPLTGDKWGERWLPPLQPTRSAPCSPPAQPPAAHPLSPPTASVPRCVPMPVVMRTMLQPTALPAVTSHTRGAHSTPRNPCLSLTTRPLPSTHVFTRPSTHASTPPRVSLVPQPCHPQKEWWHAL